MTKVCNKMATDYIKGALEAYDKDPKSLEFEQKVAIEIASPAPLFEPGCPEGEDASCNPTPLEETVKQLKPLISTDGDTTTLKSSGMTCTPLEEYVDQILNYPDPK